MGRIRASFKSFPCSMKAVKSTPFAALSGILPSVKEQKRTCDVFQDSFCASRKKSGGGSLGTCTTLRGKISSRWPQCLVNSAVLLLLLSENHAPLFLNVWD